MTSDGDGEADAIVIERRLQRALAAASPSRLKSAMLTAVTGSAARVRPMFCLTVTRAASGGEPSELAWASAIAIEMMHCASLVHDDLPCFDDASERRGRPSLHRRFGEATALLAGDALIVAAFSHLARANAPSLFIAELARATGAEGGLVSGQALELEAVVDVGAYHAAKTGALFEVAARLAATTVNVPEEPFARLGRKLGLLYQVADDLADTFGDAAKLGKPTGQDVVHQRPSASVTLDRSEAIVLLDARQRELVEAVPRGPGEERLRVFLEHVGRRLRERLRP